MTFNSAGLHRPVEGNGVNFIWMTDSPFCTAPTGLRVFDEPLSQR